MCVCMCLRTKRPVKGTVVERVSSKHAVSTAAPPLPHVKLKSVPHCVCVNDPGGTPTPAALRAFPSTCLLCPGCGPVREDYAEECSRAHLLKQERGQGGAGGMDMKFMFTGAS